MKITKLYFSIFLSTAMIQSFGSLITVAEWNFNNFPESTTVGGNGEEVDADIGDGLLFVVNGPTVGTNFERSTTGGTTVNASDGTPADGYLHFRRRERWHNGIFDIRVDTTGLENINFSFAMAMPNDAPDDITVSWTVDEGDTLNTLETIPRNFGWTAFSYDLPSGADNQEELWFRFTFAGTGGGLRMVGRPCGLTM